MTNNPRDHLISVVKQITKVLPDVLDIASLKTAGSYRDKIEAAARRLFKDIQSGLVGAWVRNFGIVMRGIIRDGLRDAFTTGGADIGIPEEDFINADWADLDKIITEEQSHIDDFAAYIVDQAQQDGREADSIIPRVDMWANRWDDVRSRAKVILGKDEKLEWVLGRTEEHCQTCADLHGKVKRASYWVAHVLPRNPPNPKLECKGFQCDCNLEATTKPVTRGRLPSGL